MKQHQRMVCTVLDLCPLTRCLSLYVPGNHSVTVLNTFLCTRHAVFVYSQTLYSVHSYQLYIIRSYQYQVQSVIILALFVTNFKICNCQMSTIKHLYTKHFWKILCANSAILNLVWFMRSIFFSPFLLCIEVSNYIYEHQEVNMDYVQGMTKQLKMSVWYIYIYISSLVQDSNYGMLLGEKV